MWGASGPGDGSRRHRGFGLTFVSEVELPGVPEAASANGAAPDLEIRRAAVADVERAWSGPGSEPAVAETVLDGLPYRAERGAEGDHRFTYGDAAAFHLSDDRRTLLCAPADETSPGWRRVLLDSVLATVSLLHGFEALHASAVAGSGGGVVAFMGRTGGGKTTLAAELVRRGRPLVCDDVLALSRDAAGAIVAHPAPPVMNLPHAAASLPARTLGTFDDEDWIAIDHFAVEPAPLAAICLLDRRSGLDPAIRPAGASAIDLLSHGLHSGSDPARMQARFELLADVAAHTPAFVLEAGPRTAPSRLADLAEATVPGLRSPAAAGVTP